MMNNKLSALALALAMTVSGNVFAAEVAAGAAGGTSGGATAGDGFVLCPGILAGFPQRSRFLGRCRPPAVSAFRLLLCSGHVCGGVG